MTAIKPTHCKYLLHLPESSNPSSMELGADVRVELLGDLRVRLTCETDNRWVEFTTDADALAILRAVDDGRKAAP